MLAFEWFLPIHHLSVEKTVFLGFTRFDDKVAHLLPELVVKCGCTHGCIFAHGSTCTDGREEAVAIANNGSELCTLVELAAKLLVFPGRAFSKPFLEGPDFSSFHVRVSIEVFGTVIFLIVVGLFILYLKLFAC